MVDVEFIGQLVDSMEEAVVKMEEAIENKNADEASKLKVFIFDLHRQVGGVMGVGK